MKKNNAREGLLSEVLDLEGRHWIFELATGTGKSKLALEKIKNSVPKRGNILIVVPRNVHKETWKEEIGKWFSDCSNRFSINYTTYVSLPKHAGKYAYVIFDECHHLSERCRESLNSFTIDHALFLSATVSKGLKAYLYDTFKSLKVIKADLRDVIDDGILPDPKVYLLPLQLNNHSINQIIVKNPKASGEPVKVHWKDRWNYSKVKNVPVHIYCTEVQYMHDLNSQIKWWKNRYMRCRNEGVKTRWLKLCSDRLIWLSRRKDAIVKELLEEHLYLHRTLTFCSSIEQTEVLGENCINSRNKISEEILNQFNRGDIHHITACNMLNEGVNLHNCRIGIYANLNSSETIVKQRAGRLLRHPEPVIIIPYFKGTREEELVDNMLENYNPKLVKRVNFIGEIVI